MKRKLVDPKMKMKKLITKHNMTEKELEAFEAVTKAATLILHLPKLHPMEKEEACHDIHKLQLRLLARPGLRVLGWKSK